MMGPEYFTVAGYHTDGEILCSDCGEKQALPASAQITVAQAYEEFPEGLNCASCFLEIVEAPIEDDEWKGDE